MAKTGLPNFILKCTGPWRGLQKQQSWASSTSGSHLTAESDVLTLLNQIWMVFAEYLVGSTATLFCSGWAYYDGTHSAALFEKEYTSNTQAVADGFLQTGYGSGLSAGNSDSMAPEVCIRLQSPIGFSKTGKPVTMKHYIHWTGGVGQSPSFSSGSAANIAKLGNGSLLNSIVLASPHGAQGQWAAYQYFANHQMQRKRKKGTSSSSQSETDVLLKVLESAAGTGLWQTLEGAFLP